MCRVRVTLLAGVSALAIAAALPESALASDLPPRPAIAAKKQPTFQDRWTWWVEGGASLIEGDPGVAGMSGFDVNAQHVGWEAAGGIEYQPAGSPWIWSAQFRYGQHGSNTASSNPIATFLAGNFATTPITVVGTNSATRKEHHWVADFMVGRDLGLGGGQNTLRFGVRVAEITGKTTGSAQWSQFGTPTNCTAPLGIIPYCATERRDYVQKSSFLGAGPRVALDGNVPLGNNWAFDYGVGVAGLFGRRKAEQTVSISQIPPTAIPTPICVAGCPSGTPSSSSGNAFVFNVDAMLGLSFAITQNVSLMVNYRFDGYFNALRGYDTNGNVTNLDRFYHGPMLRVTVTN